MSFHRMPGFTADVSAYRSANVYRMGAGISVGAAASHFAGPARNAAGLLRSSPNAPAHPNTFPPDWLSEITTYQPWVGGIPAGVISALWPYTWCNGVPVDLRTDRAHCGSCNNSCAGDGTVTNPDDDLCFCLNGGCACRAHCPQLTTYPDGSLHWWTSCGTDCDSPEQCRTWRCRDLTSDPNNCGACGNACGPLETCCPGSPAGCVNIKSDSQNCGACGHACTFENGTGMCVNGNCQLTSCNPGYTMCGPKDAPYCTNLLTDSRNCTACGKACAANQICVGGCTCPQGETLCNNVCVNTSTDNNNCGKCGVPCVTGTTCCGGSCCPSPKICCQGSCVDKTSDPMNCGSCGHVCPLSCSGPSGTKSMCVGGSCQPLTSVTCYRIDGTSRCQVGQETYSAFDAADALKCANHDWPGYVNSCGPPLQDYPVSLYTTVDTMTCPSGWQCQQTVMQPAQSSGDAVTCLSTKYTPAAGYMVVAGSCTPYQCK